MKNLKSKLNTFIEAAEHPSCEYLKTGIDGLDKTFGGGLPEGLHIFAGSPGSGKTTLAIQIANQVARNGGESIIFELEMASEYIMARGITQAAYFDNPANPNNPFACRLAYPNKKEPFSAATMERIRKGAEIFGEYADRVFIDTRTSKVFDIMDEVEEYVRLNNSRPLVVVDHLRCIRVDGVSDEYEAESVAVEALKALSVNCHIPVILIATLNKEGLRKEGGLSAVRGSTDIVYAADSLTTLTKQEDGTVEANTVKNRNGSCGTASLFFRGEYGVFRDGFAPETPAEIERAMTDPNAPTDVPSFEDLIAEFRRGQ